MERCSPTRVIFWISWGWKIWAFSAPTGVRMAPRQNWQSCVLLGKPCDEKRTDDLSGPLHPALVMAGCGNGGPQEPGTPNLGSAEASSPSEGNPGAAAPDNTAQDGDSNILIAYFSRVDKRAFGVIRQNQRGPASPPPENLNT